MYNSLDANLRHIVEIEKPICSYSQSKKNGRSYHEQEGVEVGLACWFGCCDANRFADEVLSW